MNVHLAAVEMVMFYPETMAPTLNMDLVEAEADGSEELVYGIIQGLMHHNLVRVDLLMHYPLNHISHMDISRHLITI